MCARRRIPGLACGDHIRLQVRIKNYRMFRFQDFLFEKSDEKRDRYIYIGIGEHVPSRYGEELFSGYGSGRRRGCEKGGDPAYVSVIPAEAF